MILCYIEPVLYVVTKSTMNKSKEIFGIYQSKVDMFKYAKDCDYGGLQYGVSMLLVLSTVLNHEIIKSDKLITMIRYL